MSALIKRVRLEIFTWSSLALVLSILEGSFTGILIKNVFQEKVDGWLLNLAVAVAAGAPYYSNLLSFLWVKLSRGRDKALLISNLALVFCGCALAISFIPQTSVGLIYLLLLIVFARICWTGILTIRSNIWRANYPRYVRAKVTAKMTTLAALTMAPAAFIAGWALDKQFAAFQWLCIGFGLFAALGAFRYRLLKVRHHNKEIMREKSLPSSMSIKKMLGLLKENRPFAKYMLSMFTLGSGNLMIMTLLIIYLNEYTQLGETSQVLITLAIPLAMIPLAVSYWARLLDANHIFHFRRIHSWFFVGVIALLLLAQLSGLEFIFFIAAVLYGLSIAGGSVGWNLGHNDFVGKARPMEYMAVHVSLTGLRGLIAPLLGMSFYQWLEAIQPGNGKYAMILPLILTSSGAMLFFYFDRQRLNGNLA